MLFRSDIVELQEFVEMDVLLHKAIQVEQQLKRKGVAKRSFTNYGSSSWKDKGKKDEVWALLGVIWTRNERDMVEERFGDEGFREEEGLQISKFEI